MIPASLWRFSDAVGRRFRVALAAAACLCGAAGGSAASPDVGPTDANLVTAIDVSASIGRHEEWIQQAGLARALVHPAFLQAIAAGPRGRIGFAAFTWSSDGRFEVLVPWTVIGSAEDARRVSAALAGATLVDRSRYGGGDRDDGAPDAAMPEHRTDISAAIGFAATLLASAPYAAGRSVMNICANGTDNVGDGTGASRDRAVARGFTVNGLILGRDAALAEYFRANVMGGPGAFVMRLSDPESVGEIMMEKLRRDLLVSMSLIEPAQGRGGGQ